jgi:hypothetical protein
VDKLLAIIFLPPKESPIERFALHKVAGYEFPPQSSPVPDEAATNHSARDGMLGKRKSKSALQHREQEALLVVSSGG